MPLACGLLNVMRRHQVPALWAHHGKKGIVL